MEIVISIAAKIAEYTVAPIGQWLGYSFHYGNNIENMKNQVEELGLARDSVQHSVDTAIRNGEEIEAIVNRWLTKVDAIKGKAMEVLEDEEKAKMRSSNGACLNLKLRHQQSKKAKKIVQDIDDVLKNGKFDKISYRPATQGIVTNMHYMNFETRMSTLKGLMEALRDANINMIGVWGMPGAGKTTLVTEVAKQAKEEKLFDDMAMAVVMQSPDLSKIQGEIADMLDLKFDKETVAGRASRLRERLTKDRKVLVILDDVWEKLDLEAVGIPHNGCKVVLTSRNKEILSCEMGTQMDFGLDVLSKEEAWSLFEKMVGDSLKDPNLQSIATQVCEECANLPIALVTVATALKNKRLFHWKDALRQLRRPSPRHQNRMQKSIYSAIKLSYNHLESPELRSFFFLCGQMGFMIFYQDLIKYCFGLCLFHGISTLEEARNRVYTLVRSLKDSCLLLEDPHTNEYVRMHDLVRDVAILIAEAENVLLMRKDDPTKWPDEDARKICTSISIHSRDIHELPDRFECPKLRLLSVYGQDRYFKISDTFFKGMSELKVLDFTKMRLSSLPSSINLLTKLQTLWLDQCLLGDIAVIGELRNLEILSLAWSEFKQLPTQIRNLTHLRLLDLRNCTKLEVIPSNVLSCLIRLEELFVGNSFTQWEVEGLNNERASLAELKHLSQLTTLELDIPDAKILPEDLFFGKLQRYKIFIGDVWDWSDKHENSRTLKLKLNTSFQLGRGIKMLLNGVEDLCLDELKGVESIIYELDTEGFQQLKHLHVQNNVEIKYIINSRGLVIDYIVFPALEIFSLKNLINLKEICHGQLPLTSFRNLRIVKVEHCEKLKFAFSSSIAKGLSQLQELEIRECSIMGTIVLKEEAGVEDRDMILLPQLRCLVLHRLPKLMSILSTQKSVINVAGEIIPECDLDFHMPILLDQVAFPNLEIIEISNIKEINQLVSNSIHKLQKVIVEDCGSLRNIFPPNTLRRLQNLKEVKILGCTSVEVVFGGVNVKETIDMVPSNSMLRDLMLYNPPNLKHVWSSDPFEVLFFDDLREVEVDSCKSLKSLFPVSVAKSLVRLVRLQIKNCRVEEIVALEDGSGTAIEFVFPQVTLLILEDLPELKCFYPRKHASKWPSLKTLEINNCPRLQICTSADLSFQDKNGPGHHYVPIEHPLMLTIEVRARSS